MIALTKILEYFKANSEPSEKQFRETWSSFWHKSEKIPQTQIWGLQEAIESATRSLIYQNPVTNFSDLKTTYPTAQIGWAAMVTSEGYIYSYNGADWVNTGLKAFPENVLTRSVQTLSTEEQNQVRTNINAGADIDNNRLTIDKSITGSINEILLKNGYNHTIEGYYVAKSDGLLKYASSYKSSDYKIIDINNDITITGYNGVTASICSFYDQYKDYISSVDTGKEGAQTYTVPKVNIPNGAIYMRSTALKIQPNTKILNGTLDAITQYILSLDTPAPNYDNIGWINSITGLPTYGTTYRCTGFIPIDSTMDIVVTGYDGGADDGVTGKPAIITFYNIFGDRISSYTSGIAENKTIVIPVSEIPTDTAYIRCTAEYGKNMGIVGFAKSYNSNINLSKLLKPTFDTLGYVDKRNGNIVFGGSAHKITTYLPINKSNKITVTGYAGSNTGVVSIVYFYDKALNPISPLLLPTDGNQTVILDRTNIPDSASYFIACGYVNKPQAILGLSIINICDRMTDIAKSINILSYTNNGYSEPNKDNSAIEIVGGDYGNFGASYVLKNNNTNGTCHLAFEFKLGEDVNKISQQKTIVRFEKGDQYIEFFVQENPTTEFKGVDYRVESESIIQSSIPLPYYNSAFGVKSNIITGGDRLNQLLDKRTLEFDRNSAKMCYKPLSGTDLFTLRIVPVDGNGDIINTRWSTAQDILSNWDTAYLEITDTAINIVCPKLLLSWIFNYADYGTMQDLYVAINNTLHNKIFSGAKFIIEDINSSGYMSDGTKYDKTKLVRAKMMIATTYPRTLTDLNNSFIDSFPLYITYAIDDTWHSFELATMLLYNRLAWTIDGQYKNLNGDMLIDNIKNFIKGSTIKLGYDLPIKVKNIQLDINGYNDIELKEYPGLSHIIVSKLHPMIMNFYQHDVYYKGNDGEPLELQRKFESNGGTIPNTLQNPDTNYIGDDCIQSNREHLVFPSYVFEKSLQLLNDRGYRFISDTELSMRLKSGVYDHNRYYTLGFDDYPTYIYANKRLRGIFEKNRCFPYFALELGLYVGEDAPATTYNPSVYMSECHDNATHREALQKRIRSLQNNGWQVQLHGAKRGQVFQSLTYQEILDHIDDAVNIADYYGIESNKWCYAGNYYTPNTIKIMEHRGFLLSTSIVGNFIARCHHLNYCPRSSVLYIDNDIERTIV